MQPHNRGKSHATIRRPILSSREWVVLNPIAAARHTLANWHLLGSINDESVLRVLSFLDGRSLAAVGQVCKHLRGMASDDAMWLQACRAEWGVSPDHLSRNHAPVEGKQLYFFAIQSMRTMTQQMLQEQCLRSMHTTIHHSVPLPTPSFTHSFPA